MNEKMLWMKRSLHNHCPGCNDILRKKTTDGFMCYACNGTHPDADKIREYLEKYFDEKAYLLDENKAFEQTKTSEQIEEKIK